MVPPLVRVQVMQSLIRDNQLVARALNFPTRRDLPKWFIGEWGDRGCNCSFVRRIILKGAIRTFRV